VRPQGVGKLKKMHSPHRVSNPRPFRLLHVEGKEQYQIGLQIWKILINRTWEAVRENFKLSDKEYLGHFSDI
jgi:hypothetical protein